MRISAFFVLAAYLAANAYVAARTSIFLHRNLPERVAKLVSLLTAGVYSVFAMGMPLGYILPEGTLRKAIMRVSFGFYGIFIYLFSAYALIEVLARLSKRFHRTEKLTARRGNPKLIFGGAVWFGIILTCILGIHHASELTVKRYDAESPRMAAGAKACAWCSSRICIWDTASARNASRTWSKRSTRRTRISFSSRAISLITPWTESTIRSR